MTEPAFQTWRDFFDFQAATYDQNEFTRNTLVEVQFMVEVLGLAPGMRLLDVGCGTGRHAIEFARRGLHVTGIDFSPGMLAQARTRSAELDVEFIEADATQWQAEVPFDAAICVCEGAFGLIGHDEDPVGHDLAILQNVRQSLRPGAPFLLTALCAYSQIRQMSDQDIEAGAFDPATMVAHYANTMNLPSGPVTINIRERLFIPPEVTAMLHHAGFETLHVYGGTAGEWGRRALKLDEIEAMYIARARE